MTMILCPDGSTIEWNDWIKTPDAIPFLRELRAQSLAKEKVKRIGRAWSTAVQAQHSLGDIERRVGRADPWVAGAIDHIHQMMEKQQKDFEID